MLFFVACAQGPKGMAKLVGHFLTETFRHQVFTRNGTLHERWGTGVAALTMAIEEFNLVRFCMLVGWGVSMFRIGWCFFSLSLSFLTFGGLLRGGILA